MLGTKFVVAVYNSLLILFVDLLRLRWRTLDHPKWANEG